MGVMHYLTIARDHGLPVPQLYRRPLNGSDSWTVTVHYRQCETESDLQPLDYEDFPFADFPMTQCHGCYEQARQDPDGLQMTRAVAALTNLATFARMQTMLEARLGDLATTAAADPQKWCGFLDDYIMHRHRYVPRPDQAGLSLAAATEPIDEDHPLGAFALELYQDLALQAQRLTGPNPIGQYLRTNSNHPSRPQLRAVYTSVTGIPSELNVHACEDAALISECRTIHEGQRGWRIIEWDAELDEFAALGSAVEAADYSDTELEQALEVYRHSHTSATFADVLHAVRAAYAA